MNPLEMSSGGRSAADIANKLLMARGKKMGPVRPLGQQRVHPEDSVLGAAVALADPGLHLRDYDVLIERAFRPEWWSSGVVVKAADDGTVTLVNRPGGRPAADDEFRLIEYNFPLFFGLALQMYQATLVSNDTPYDRWRESRGALSPQALLGLEVFLGQAPRPLATGGVRAAGRCINCHAGAEFTDASVASVNRSGITRLREGQDLDRGFNNIGCGRPRRTWAWAGRDPWAPGCR
jgi:hypothetical protein